MDIVNWLALISGGLAILIIVVLAIIGGWHLYSRRSLLKTASESENMGKPEKPEIVVYLRPHVSSVQCLMLCVENIGTGTAYNVQFETRAARALTPAANSSDVRFLNENNLLRKDIGCFGAGQKIEQFLMSLIGGLSEELKHPLQISVTYTDSLNHPHENRYTFDFSEFESLVQINSTQEKATLDLKSLIDVIQTGFNQVAKLSEHSRLPQNPEPKGSKTPRKKPENPPDQGEENKPLSPALQKFVAMYNAGKDAELRKTHNPSSSIHVSNETERLQNPNILPIFQTKPDSSLVAYAIDSENLYAVVPFSGCILQNDLYNSGAFGKVFECTGFDPQCKYHVKVIRPAFFKRDPANEKWTLEEKGELELKEKDH